jgi:hypothetical protein
MSELALDEIKFLKDKNTQLVREGEGLRVKIKELKISLEL